MGTNFEILIIYDIARLSEVYKANIKAYTNLNSVIFTNVFEGIEFLKANSSIKYVITKKYVGETKSFEKVFSQLVNFENGQSPHVINIGHVLQPEYYPEVTFLDDENSLRGLVREIAKREKITAMMMAKLAVKAFYPINISILVPNLSYSVSIYERILDDFSIVIKSGEKVTKDLIKRLLKTDSILYVKSIDRLTIVNEASKNLIQYLSSKELSLEERIKVTEAGFGIGQEIANDIGVDSNTIKVADATIESMKLSVTQSKSLKVLLDNLLDNQSSFKYKHSMLIIYIGTKIIEDSEWGSQDLLDKLCFVAMFADVTLDDSLAKAQFYPAILEALDEDKKALIKIHALKSAQIVSKVQRIPIGAESIIKLHHGSKNGLGLDANTFNISPAGLIYILSSEYAVKVIDSKEKGLPISKKLLLTSIKEKFSNNPRFKQYTLCLERALSK